MIYVRSQKVSFPLDKYAEQTLLTRLGGSVGLPTINNAQSTITAWLSGEGAFAVLNALRRLLPNHGERAGEGAERMAKHK
jgi:hypothetical protein